MVNGNKRQCRKKFGLRVKFLVINVFFFFNFFTSKKTFGINCWSKYENMTYL